MKLTSEERDALLDEYRENLLIGARFFLGLRHEHAHEKRVAMLNGIRGRFRRIRALDEVRELARRDVCEVCKDCIEPDRGPRCVKHANAERYIDGTWDCEP